MNKVKHKAVESTYYILYHRLYYKGNRLLSNKVLGVLKK